MKLTHSESILIDLLAGRPRQVLGKNELIVAFGHRPDYDQPKRSEILIRRLRTKSLEQLGYPLPLETVYGIGFAFMAPIVLA